MLLMFYDYPMLDMKKLRSVYSASLKTEKQNEELEKYITDVFFHQKNAVYAVWSVDDRYTSALRIEPYLDGYLISGLETAPDERRKGYAKALLLEAIHTMCEKGIAVFYAHVHRRNMASLNLHASCGFQQYLDYSRLLDGTVTSQYFTLRWTQNG